MQIVITLTESDSSELIAAVLSAVQGKQVSQTGQTAATATPVVEIKTAKVKKEKPESEIKAEAKAEVKAESEPEPEKAAPVVKEPTIVEIRAKVAELIRHESNGKENKTKMKAWVSEYGATGIEDLPKEKYTEFMTNLKTL